MAYSYSPEDLADIQALIQSYLDRGLTYQAKNLYNFTVGNMPDAAQTLKVPWTPAVPTYVTEQVEGGVQFRATGTFNPLDTSQPAPAWDPAYGAFTQPMEPAPVASAPAAPGPPPGPSADQLSARATFQRMLDEWGLGALGEAVWGAISSNTPAELIVNDVIRKSDLYKQRFAGLAELQRKGRSISEAQYIDLERSYTQVFRSAGLPAGFYDSADDFAKLIGNEVSPAEVADRVTLAAAYAFQSPPEMRAEAARLYGWGAGEITALALDPDKALPLLRQQYVAAQTSATAQRSGYGTLTRNEAERLAALNVSEDRAASGFSALASSRELFRPIEFGEDEISRETQLGAAFEGNAAAQETINERERRRRARLQAGGGFAAGRSGIGGLGEAS